MTPQTGTAVPFRCTAAVNDRPAIREALSAAPSRITTGSAAVPQN